MSRNSSQLTRVTRAKSAATFRASLLQDGVGGVQHLDNQSTGLCLHASQEMEGLPIASSPQVSPRAKWQIPSSHLPSPE